MSEHVAYSFRCSLTPVEVFARLQQLGPWEWNERDSDSWGYYLSAAPYVEDPFRVMVKIFAEAGDEYVLDLLFRYDREDASARAKYQDARTTLFERLLPALGARSIAETEPRE